MPPSRISWPLFGSRCVQSSIQAQLIARRAHSNPHHVLNCGRWLGQTQSAISTPPRSWQLRAMTLVRPAARRVDPSLEAAVLSSLLSSFPAKSVPFCARFCA